MCHLTWARLALDSYTGESYSHNDVECILVKYPTMQAISVRGTKGVRDVFRDARVLPRPAANVGWGHAGFIAGGAGLASETTIIADLDPEKPIALMGHSMGGAVSQVLAYLLLQKGLPVAEWCGFASPRVFLGSRKWRGVRLTNYCYGHDIVPQYMPPGLIYSHPVPLTKVGKKSTFFPTIDDHDMVNYLKAMGG